MQTSDPPQFCHYNCIFVCIGYLTQTQRYIYISQILHFALRFVPVASAAVHVSLRRARGMSYKQFVYADGAVFSTSKVY